MFGMNQQNQLPYPTNALTLQPMAFDINHPPFVAQVQAHPQIAQFLAPVSGMVIMNIQENSNRNPVRTFTYNQLSQNNYANQDFVNLMGTVVDYLTYVMFVERKFTDLEQAARAVIPYIVEVFCAINVQKYGGLQQIVGAQGIQAVSQLLGQFQQLGQQISMMKQQMAQQSQGFNQPGFGGMQRAPATNMQPMGGFNQAPPQQQGNSGLFVHGNTTSPAQPEQAGQVVSRYGRYRTVNPVETVPTQVQYAPNPPVSKQDNLVAQPFVSRQTPTSFEDLPMTGGNEVLTQAQWKPTVDQPYFPAYSPTIKAITYERNDKGNVIATVRQKDNNPMFDYAQHETAEAFGYRAKNSNTTVDVKKIEAVIQATEQETITIDISEPDPVLDSESIVFAPHLMEANLETALLSHQTRMARVMVKKPQGIKLFKSNVFLLESLGRMAPEDRVILMEMQKAKTFMELQRQMLGAAETMSRGVWTALDRTLSETVSRALKFRLGIDLWMTTFTGDVEELLDLLNAQYPSGQAALNFHQTQIISEVLTLADKEMTHEVIAIYTTGDDLPTSVQDEFGFLSREVTITNVMLDSVNLDLNFHANLGSQILPENTPLMYSIAKKIFLDENKSASKPSRHFIVTEDNRILELSRSLLNMDYYILTLVK